MCRGEKSSCQISPLVRELDQGVPDEDFRFFIFAIGYHGAASLIAQLVKNPPARQEILAQFLGQGDVLEKG